MDKNIELPEGWNIVDLGDIVDKMTNGASVPQFEDKIGYPISRIETIWNELIDLNRVKYITQNEPEFVDKYSIKKNDILFSHINSDPHLGKTAIFKFDKLILIHGINLLLIRPGERVKADYLNYHFKYLRKTGLFANIAQKSVNQSSINQSKLKKVRVVLPPLSEQEKIVQKIEELFSELDKGIENLKTAQQQLKVYRQAVLKWAFEGKLTNENVKDGKLPDGWKLSKVSDVANAIGGYAFKSSEFKESGKYQVLRMGNVRPGKLRFSESPVFFEPDDVVLRKALLKINDVIITQTGTRQKRDYGFTAIIDKNNLLLNQRIAAIRLSEQCLPKFFLYFTWTDTFKNQFFANETGNVGQGNVGMKAITDTFLPCPSIEIQEIIVQEIETRLSVCDKIEETITTSLQQAEALRQSILKKAFEGKLVKQEAKVISLNKLITTEQEQEWMRKVLAGKIVSICHKDKNFGHTKFQKTLYLIEQYAQLEFNTSYIKQVAGPFDKDFFFPFIEEAKVNAWLIEKPKRQVTFFEPAVNMGNLINNYETYFIDKKDKIQFVIDALKDKDTHASELIATVYAIWNNYLIANSELQIAQLVQEVYEWSASKAKFSETAIADIWQWMKELGLIPNGFGKPISK